MLSEDEWYWIKKGRKEIFVVWQMLGEDDMWHKSFSFIRLEKRKTEHIHESWEKQPDEGVTKNNIILRI